MRQVYFVLMAITFCMPTFASLTQVTIKNKSAAVIKAKVDSTNQWTGQITEGSQQVISTSAEHDTLKIYVLEMTQNWACGWVYSFGSAADNTLNSKQHVVTVTGRLSAFNLHPWGYINCRN